MKYLVPPIVIPMLLFIGIVAYALLRPPIVVGHSLARIDCAASLARQRLPRLCDCGDFFCHHCEAAGKAGFFNARAFRQLNQV
jgi:hypothetical protein